jgi:hypothetical protein
MPHGSRSRYTNNGCRCGLCREAQRQYEAKRLGRKIQPRVPFIIFNADLLFTERRR